GLMAALIVGRNDPGFLHNGPLAGLVAVCAGSDVMHPVASLFVGAVAGALFVWAFTATQNRLKVDDVLGVWPLHGLCGAWGGIAAGIFGAEALGGLGGVSLMAQVIGTVVGAVYAFGAGLLVYGLIKAVMGLRLSDEEEYEGADLSIHKINATPR
ncbi:MAG: ammonium transporter, partial [Granulosicoccaceae bacterium]